MTNTVEIGDPERGNAPLFGFALQEDDSIGALTRSQDRPGQQAGVSEQGQVGVRSVHISGELAQPDCAGAEPSRAAGGPSKVDAEAAAYKPPYQPWYERDFRGDPYVCDMNPVARMIYRSLLQRGWVTDNPPYLPNDPDALRFWADCPTDLWKEHKSSVLKMFKVTEDGKWLYNRRSLEEYRKVGEAHDRKCEGGRRSRQKTTAAQPSSARLSSSMTKQSSSSTRIQNHNQTQKREAGALFNATDVARGFFERTGLGFNLKSLNASQMAIDWLMKDLEVEAEPAVEILAERWAAHKASGSKPTEIFYWLQDGRYQDDGEGRAKPIPDDRNPVVLQRRREAAIREAEAREKSA